MSEENQIVKQETYRMRDLLENKTFDVETKGGVLIPVSLELIDKLVTIKQGDRKPDIAEKMMFCNMIVEQRCNPYLGECWLVNMKGRYVPIISAQKRIGKAQSLPDYDGYEWGWITSDGTRHAAGFASKAKREEIIGGWGQICFTNRKIPFYHEIFMAEYGGKERPITMLLKTLRDQTHKFAFANEMGNLNTENEMDYLPEPNYTPETPKRAARKPVESQAVEPEPENPEPPEPEQKEPVQVNQLIVDCLAGLIEAWLDKNPDLRIADHDEQIDSWAVFCAGTLGGATELYWCYDEDMKKTFKLDGFNEKNLVQLKKAVDELEILDEPEEPKTPEDEPETKPEPIVYVCAKGHEFDEPKQGGNGAAICPKCLTKNIKVK